MLALAHEETATAASAKSRLRAYDRKSTTLEAAERTAAVEFTAEEEASERCPEG